MCVAVAEGTAPAAELYKGLLFPPHPAPLASHPAPLAALTTQDYKKKGVCAPPFVVTLAARYIGRER